MGIKEKELDYLNEKAHKHDVYGLFHFNNPTLFPFYPYRYQLLRVLVLFLNLVQQLP